MFKFDSNGLIPAIIQDNKTKKVLMLGYMNEESFNLTLKTNKITFFSRARQKLWIKGETSGNYLHVVDFAIDCDKDALIFFVKTNHENKVCHLNKNSCFDKSNLDFLYDLEQIIESRKLEKNSDSYTNKLFESGVKKICKKVVEESSEVVIAALSEGKERVIEESSDLIFHLLVLLNEQNVKFDDIVNCLLKRNVKKGN